MDPDQPVCSFIVLVLVIVIVIVLVSGIEETKERLTL
jgi:hypothetical protein